MGLLFAGARQAGTANQFDTNRIVIADAAILGRRGLRRAEPEEAQSGVRRSANPHWISAITAISPPRPAPTTTVSHELTPATADHGQGKRAYRASLARVLGEHLPSASALS